MTEWTYDRRVGVIPEWEKDSKIITQQDETSITIRANTQALRSLANHLLRLVDKNVPVVAHIHYDDHAESENGSVELIIDKLA